VVRKEITKEKFRLMIWSLLGIGIVTNAIIYTYATFTKGNLTLLGIVFMSGGLLGYGIGLAMSRTWKIKDYD
jgi:hypothetical protein